MNLSLRLLFLSVYISMSSGQERPMTLPLDQSNRPSEMKYYENVESERGKGKKKRRRKRNEGGRVE